MSVKENSGKNCGSDIEQTSGTKTTVAAKQIHGRTSYDQLLWWRQEGASEKSARVSPSCFPHEQAKNQRNITVLKLLRQALGALGYSHFRHLIYLHGRLNHEACASPRLVFEIANFHLRVLYIPRKWQENVTQILGHGHTFWKGPPTVLMTNLHWNDQFWPISFLILSKHHRERRGKSMFRGGAMRPTKPHIQNQFNVGTKKFDKSKTTTKDVHHAHNYLIWPRRRPPKTS